MWLFQIEVLLFFRELCCDPSLANPNTAYVFVCDSWSRFQVAKARYGEPPLVEQPSNEVDPEQLLVVDLQREQLVKENQELKEQLQEMIKNSGSASSLIFDKFKSAIKLFEDIESGFLTNTKRMVSFFPPDM